MLLLLLLPFSGAATLKEGRGVVKGVHCDYIKLCEVAALDRCNSGTKFVIQQEKGVR